MTRYFAIICITLFSMGVVAQKEEINETTTYYLIRHAEKDRSDPSDENPHLTESGHKRAQRWSSILQHIQFDAVYATDYNRTRETAQPTAVDNQLEIIIYSADSNFDVAFKRSARGNTVLVVGHSNTIPEFVNAVIGRKKYGHIDDGNNGNLYVITITDGKITDTLLTIN